MSNKITVELDNTLYEILTRLSLRFNVSIEKLLVMAAYETYANEELEKHIQKQETLWSLINNWLDNIREGNATNEQFRIALESAIELQNMKFEQKSLDPEKPKEKDK